MFPNNDIPLSAKKGNVVTNCKPQVQLASCCTNHCYRFSLTRGEFSCILASDSATATWTFPLDAVFSNNTIKKTHVVSVRHFQLQARNPLRNDLKSILGLPTELNMICVQRIFLVKCVQPDHVSFSSNRFFNTKNCQKRKRKVHVDINGG